ncbi:hypothetical protein EC988_002002 [Linderina pennispora]|nr:hypothetical protein EC988_002002 [Linderina pennispora]
MGAGKTTLYTQLKYKKQQPTQTSMAVNASEVTVDSTRAFLVDVPGHQKFLFDRDAQLAGARGVVFVVDSVAIADNVRETAEQLYEVLANSKVQELETPVLVVCNKQDEMAALTNTRVRKLLEDEIDNLRGSRQAALDALGDTAEDDARAGDFLGYDGKKFSFDDIQNDVQFNECVLAQGHDLGGVTYVESWIGEALS